MTNITKTNYKYLVESIKDDIISLIADRFGENTAKSELVWYALMNDIFSDNIKVPKRLKNIETVNYDKLTSEEYYLGLRFIKKECGLREVIIYRLMGEYEISPHAVTPGKNIGDPLKIEDFYTQGDRTYLNVRVRGGKNKQYLLKNDMVDLINKYIKETENYKNGNYGYLFPVYYRSIPGGMVYHNLFHNFNRKSNSIRNVLINNGIIPKNKKVVPFSVVGSANRKNGSYTEDHLSRTI